MKYSAQREMIREIVVGNRNHLSADEVYSAVKQEMPNISLATVYRNLNHLASEGIIGKVAIPGGGDRFDGFAHQHCHLLCEKCGHIDDIELSLMKEIDQAIQKEKQFTVNNRHFIALGICEKCQKEMH